MKLMKTPRTVGIAITGTCNLRCKYCCFFTSAGDVGQDLPKEEWLTFFEELNACAVMEVFLSGGEHFYRLDLKEIIEGIVHNRMRFSIVSNGTLITEEMAAFLASTKRCNMVRVSIDGSTPITHDVYRGKGSFFKAVEGIKVLQKQGICVTVRVTIHKQNVGDLNEIAELLLDDISLPNFSTHSASYLGLCRKNAEKIQLSIEERSLAAETLLKLNRKYNGRIKTSGGPLADTINWLKMEQTRKEGKECLQGGGYLSVCNEMFKGIAVSANGIIIPSDDMNYIELGKINKDSLENVWQNHLELKRLRNRHNIPLSHFEYCHECNYINYCTGGSPVLAYARLGDDNNPNPDECLKHFKEMGGKLPNEQLLATCNGI